MDYWKVFSEDTVVTSLQGEDMESIIDELIRALTESKSISPRQGKIVRETLDKKIEQGATGAIGHGVAVPHVKIPQAKSTVAAFGRSENGVDFRAGDGVPVNLFFLVVGPDDAPEEHLNFMRWIAGICRSPDFRRFAMGCAGKKDMFELLKEMAET